MKAFHYRKRLQKLIDHLDHGKLGHPVFNFGQWNDGEKVNHCRTNGCAIGECPVLFPLQWTFRTYHLQWGGRDRPVLKKRIRLRNCYRDDLDPSVKSAALFFGVDYETAYRMFTPDGSGLSCTAKRKTVAKHLKKFLSLYEH